MRLYIHKMLYYAVTFINNTVHLCKYFAFISFFTYTKYYTILYYIIKSLFDFFVFFVLLLDLSF